MALPGKLHLFRNEYHTVCCAKSGILYSLEIVEGKDRPRDLGPKEFDNEGKTTGLLMCFSHPIWKTDHLVVMDSVFCVLKALVALKQCGIYGLALIKKRRYWPKYIDGHDIDAYFVVSDVVTFCN